MNNRYVSNITKVGLPKSFEERCRISESCLPDAPYRTSLKRLHNEMLDEIKQHRFYREHKGCTGCWGELHQCGCGEADLIKTEER